MQMTSSNNPKKQFLGSKQAIMQREANSKVLNNTTIKHLGNQEEPIEIFPPEIFFKGKSHASDRFTNLNFPLPQTSSPTRTMK